MTALRKSVLFAAFASSATIIAALTASHCVAQAPAQQNAVLPEASAGSRAPEIKDLSLGEQYAVIVQRGQVVERYEGKLLVAGNEWLLLRHVSEGLADPQTQDDIGVIPFLERKMTK